ncbi:MAG TPA: 16S rRNA (adenine(1518)-N(6)/adenine(1519)-N(6))-dimethyltransferase RsmA [Buchnera sp. (in: enterobacteria)]|nr:16S rRNA (adenine(1518)-N(6)/adenine(1519)-N(6))-dimethyltransferase RsmA [Buchnera sp. (in: enterobacteria)]
MLTNNNKHYNSHIPNKKLGQHFLIEQSVINKIVQFIQPKLKDNILEIGPGLAALTEPICFFLERLYVIELDSNLANCLANRSFSDKLKIFQKNAINFNFFDIFNKKNKKIRIFGNLPYNISIRFILYLFKFFSIIEDMHFMLQKEVADRLSASPGMKCYGRLSIIAQYYCNVEPLLTVFPSAFLPVPKVNSVFIRLIPHIKLPIPISKIKVLEMITNAAFGQRRKILRHSLSKFFHIETMMALGINPMLRAENLTISQYFKLANYLTTQ